MWPRSGAVGDVPGGVLPSAASECGRVSRDCSLCLGQCSQEPGEWQGGTEGCGNSKGRGQVQNMLLRKRAGQAAVMGGGERSAGQGLEDWKRARRASPLDVTFFLVLGIPSSLSPSQISVDEKAHTELLTVGFCVLAGQEWSRDFRETPALPIGTLTGVPQ